jgi:uncharacterized protein (DUF2249 family)/quercetin dioxygenase-like cupin family protein
MPETDSEPAVIDVRPIVKPQRHPLIFDALEKLAVGESIVVKNDHDPIPLRGQIEAIFGEQFGWRYLEKGPEIFRLQLTRHMNAPADWKRPEAKKSALPMALSSQENSASTRAATPVPVQADLLEHIATVSHAGPQWAHESEDLDVTLLSWQGGKRLEAHINNEVDVVLLGVEGEGVVTINGAEHEVRPGVLLLIPKGCERAIVSTSQQFSYLSVHRRRRGLMPVNHLLMALPS